MTRIAGHQDLAATLAASATTPRTHTPTAARPPGPLPRAAGADAVVTLSGGAATRPSDTYTMPTATLDYFAFGDENALGSPSGPTRLEYNVYRPDGLAIDGLTRPYTVAATGEPLTGATADKYRSLLLDVAQGRIDLYRRGRQDGLSNGEILERLQAYDRALPASYRALVGHSSFSDPDTRYRQATHDEVMGGPVQTA